MADIQGLLLHGYKPLNTACLLFLRISDASRFKGWLRDKLPELTTGATWTPEDDSALNLAFSSKGLEALGLPERELVTFPYEFRQGMARRASVLGDLGDNAPEHWEFGGTAGSDRDQDDIHLLLMVYARDARRLRERLAGLLRPSLEHHGLKELARQEVSRLPDEKEHFGFRDAISQPVIRGFPKGDEARHPEQLNEDPRPIEPGEFLLGHPNEYGERSDSPSVSEELDKGRRLADSTFQGRRDLGRNGTYLVLRKLEQHVDAFEGFLEQYKDLAPGGMDEERKKWLAAKLVGRWPNGAPLKPGQDQEPPLDPAQPAPNGFGFRDDPRGFGCPITSHIRRTNPRDSLPPSVELSRKTSRRHRLLRRGIPYQERGQDGREVKGLLFMALNSDLSRQFEYIQRSWMNDEKQGDRFDAPDPLAANRGGTLTIPQEPIRVSVQGLARFTTMRGGGYFFLPGRRALEFLAYLAPR